MKKIFSKILVSLLIISFIITPVAFASDNLQNTNIDTRSVGQVVIDYKYELKRCAIGEHWETVYSNTYEKTLYPPVGYQYVLSYTTKEISDSTSPYDQQVKERTIVETYHYKLEQL